MQNRKLIILLKNFTKKECQQLNKFLASPFFNESEQLMLLYQFLQNFAPTFDHHHLTAEKAFYYIFGKEKYNVNVITKLFSKLFKLTEQFIAHYALKNDEIEEKSKLLVYYNHRIMPKYFNTLLQQHQKKQAKNPIQDGDFYKQQLLLEKENAMFLSKTNDRTGDINLQKFNDTLDIYYLINKLIYVCQMLNRQGSVNVDYNYTLVEELLAYIPHSPYQNIPAITLWYQVLLLLKNPEEVRYYNHLKNLLPDYIDKLPKVEIRTLYTYLENSLSRFKIERQTYYKEIFDLFKVQLQEGIIYRDNYLLPPIFKNIVTVALNLKEYDWAANFIETHKAKLPPEEQEDIYSYNLAHLYFHQKKYDRALILLQQIEYKDIFTKLSVKRMLLKIYYELREFDVLESALNAFRVFLHRHNKIAEKHRKAHQHFINYLYRIIRTLPSDTEKLQKLRLEIEAEQLLPEANWLLEKID